jgi:hypothetical protein
MIPAFDVSKLDSENYLRSIRTAVSWSRERDLYNLALDVVGEERLARCASR